MIEGAPGDTAKALPARPSAWLPVVVVALVVGTVFVSVFVGLQRAPVPLGLPLAATGGELATTLKGALGERVDVRTVSSPVDGREEVRAGSAVAAVTVSSGTLLVDYAGAQGLSETGAARDMLSRFADASGLVVTETDVVPLSDGDSRGLVSFYVTFGVTLASFILGQGLTGAATRVRLRDRLLVSAGFAIAIGVVAGTLTGPIYGALPASWPLLTATLALLSASSSLTTQALGAWLGPAGIGVSVLLLTTLGNALSGATIGRDLLPRWAQLLSPVLPPGAAVEAVTDFGYFAPTSAIPSVCILTAWAVAGLVLLVLRRGILRRHARAGAGHS